MSIKVQLAELCANRKLPMAEYKKLAAFVMMEQESSVVEKIEGFHLPEITKLICGSEILSVLPWAGKYQKVSPLYCNPEEMDVVQIILGCKTVSSFETEILQFADADILQMFKKYYDDLFALQDAKRKERTILVKKINAQKKKEEKLEASTAGTAEETSVLLMSENEEKGNASVPMEVQLSADESNLEMLRCELSKLDKYLKKNKVYIEKIRVYAAKTQENDSDENRTKVYRSLNDVKMPYEEAFLKSFISSGVVSEEYHVQFRDQGFLNRVLQCLEKGAFKDYAVPILLKLYDEGAIDLIEGPASDFLNEHHTKLCDYLIEKAPISTEDLSNPDLELLVEKAIQKELSDTTGKSISFFSKFWNTIVDQDIWRWIISKVNEITNGENIDSAISSLLLRLGGKAAKSVIEVLFDDSEATIKVSTTEVMASLLRNSGSCERDVIIETIRLLEQNNKKIQRKLNTSERKLRSHSQELFSSVYLPMEQLEELAINLKLTKGEIKASLVASHLIDIVLSLRDGLESLDLLPIADSDDWKYQNKIQFDSNTHRITTDNDCIPDTVRLRSLGFRYQDDDGEWQQYNAQASVEIDLPKSEKKVRKGYPKYEQPGKKKNGAGVLVRYTVSKKSKKGVNSQNKHRFEHKKK